MLVVVAVGAALLIAVLASGGDSQEEAQADFCTSPTSLESSLQGFQAPEPTSASQEDYEAAVSDIEDDWDQATCGPIRRCTPRSARDERLQLRSEP
ncbi:MAG TPA: hypothetical protein VFL61_04835 [Gaiellaceae bacterium]|nr:hypothetical protein [Gaiellaceae bacterium]